LYLTGAEEGFAPPVPFDLVEMEANEVLPRTYTRQELIGYLEFCRRKCQETLGAMSHEQAYRLCQFAWGELPFAELQLYNLRHVQEHAAHLGMFLGQQAGKSTRWVAKAENKPESGFLSLLGAPARRALEHAGITTLTQLAQRSEREILALHGMGPKSLPTLRQALQDAGLVFAAPR
jgi:hypothetical protein